MKTMWRKVFWLMRVVCAWGVAAGAVAAQEAEGPPAGSFGAAQPAGFEFRNLERVVWVGDTLIERERLSGYLETALTVYFPERDVTFRNLGWSADNPLGQSRASFDWNKSPDEWLRQLTNQIAAVRPTLVVVGYGMADSFSGRAGVDAFRVNLSRLVTAVRGGAEQTPVRFLFLGPVRHEKLGGAWPDPEAHNADLQLYADAMQDLAKEVRAPFVSLGKILGDGAQKRMARALTSNGIHLNEYGYWRAAEAVQIGLRWKLNSWRLGVTDQGGIRGGSYGIQVSGLTRSSNSVRFSGLLERLPVPYQAEFRGLPISTPPIMLQFVNLEPGTYELRIDGETVLTHTAEEWAKGRALWSGPDFVQAEALRQVILRKNELWFHRWRPANSTYLFGFRKHEQGQNAREIPMFDPLIEAEEKEIARLRRPVQRRYELVRAGEPAAAKPAGAGPGEAVARPAGAAAASGGVAPARQPQPQPVPEFEVAEGFEVNLWAENPKLNKPIQINFDERGRLWVASSSVYPQIQPGQVAEDRVLVLEDTNGDGRAETSAVFAEGLLIPTGVAPGDGGVYVAQSSELLHFEDRDGDGRADRRRVVLSSFGTEDTHHNLHTLRWGYDGHLYMNQSIYTHSHVETPHGVRRLNSGGIWRFDTLTQELEVFTRGGCNPWGHHWDAWGNSFFTDGAGFQGIYHAVPGAMYFTYAGARRELQSMSPGNYPKFCSLTVVESPMFPDDWQGDLITCDFRAHRIVRFRRTETGSTWQTREMPDLLRSTNVTFRPIDVTFGPDGALYVADWANPIIQHGEVDFRDPRRDKEHGRIWRVTRKGAAPAARVAFEAMTEGQLLEQTLSSNLWAREQARRLLRERAIEPLRPVPVTNAPARPPALVTEALAWAGRQGTGRAWLEALWLCEATDEVAPGQLVPLLGQGDAAVRAAAVRLLGHWLPRWPAKESDGAKPAVELLAGAAADESPRVRLEALRALARIPSARSAEIALGVLEKPMDPTLDYALWLTINDLAVPWIEAIEGGKWKPEGRARQLEFGLKAVEPALASRVLGQVLGDRPLGRDGAGPWIEIISQAGSTADLRRLFDQVLAGGFEPAAAARALKALGEAARLRNLKPAGELAGVGTLFASGPEPVRVEAVRLAGQWKELGGQLAALLAMAGAVDTATPLRAAAFDSLRMVGGPAVVEGLGSLAGAGRSPAVRRSAVAALASLDLGAAIPLAVAVAKDAAEEGEALELWRSVLAVKGAGQSLRDGLAEGSLSPVGARAGMRAAREGGRNDVELVVAFARAGGLASETAALTADVVKELAAKAAAQGDPVRGELVYRRGDLACMTCHAIGGAGGKVGPDMTSIGASAPSDYLVESLLLPNAKIKEGYHALTVETEDDQEVSGVLVRETPEELVIRNASNVEMSLAKKSIRRRQNATLSLMPAGLLDPLGEQEKLDLIAFLSRLGKPGEFDASQGGVARKYRLYVQTHTDQQNGLGNLAWERPLAEKPWIPVFSLVNGRVTRPVLQQLDTAQHWVGRLALFAAAEVQVAREGPVRLRLEAGGPAELWVNGRQVGATGESTVTLPAGTHRVVVRLDPQRMPEWFRLASPDAPFAMN